VDSQKKKAIFVSSTELSFEPASHEDPNNPGVLKKVLLKAEVCPSGKLQMLNSARMEPGKAFARHYHEDMTEVFLLVSGLAEIKVESELFRMQAGDVVLVPPLCEHEMANLGQVPVEYIVFGISEGQGGKTVCCQ
jgi:mannose-6-phosphate isomerase-like protein (cupin superfamily)